MPSVSAPFGFRPSFHNSGQMRPKAYVIASTYATNIFSGDPVKLVDAGTIQLGTSDGTRTGTVAGVTLLGTLAGVEYRDATGKPTISPYWIGGTTATEITAYVYDDPETIFEAQYTNPGTAGVDSVQTAVGEQCDFTGFTAPGGSTRTGLSTCSLAAFEVSGTGQFQIVGISNNVNQNPTDAFVVMQCRINEHAYKASTASI
jgi:hypothetical protein